MHRRMIGAAMIVGLTSGLMGVVAYEQLVRPAFADTGPPSGLFTREQNLDTNGLIRVHEQGTPTVSVGNFPATQPVTGTVNVGNLPATQPVSGTVNVGNLPATQPVSGTVTVGNFPATQNVNIVGGGITAGVPVVTKSRVSSIHLNPQASITVIDININATHIQTGGCSYLFASSLATNFEVKGGQTLDFTYAIPLTSVLIHNEDNVFSCDGSVIIFGT